MLERDASCPEAPSRCKLFESCTISEAVSAMPIRGVVEFIKRLPHRVFIVFVLRVFFSSRFHFQPKGSIFFPVSAFPRRERGSRARQSRSTDPVANDPPFIFYAHNYRRPSMPNITDRCADRMAMRSKECFAAIFTGNRSISREIQGRARKFQDSKIVDDFSTRTEWILYREWRDAQYVS